MQDEGELHRESDFHTERDLTDQYVKYAKRAACDDGAIAEGRSDAVGHLLAHCHLGIGLSVRL